MAEAASMLQDRLPKGWQVDVVSEVEELPQYDGRLTLTSPKETAITFIVEAKGVTRPSARDLVSQLRAVVPAATTQPLLLITEYANPPLRRELEDAAISYLDTTGWACLASDDPAVLVRLEGRTSRRGPGRVRRPPDSMAQRRHVLFAICFKHNRHWVSVSWPQSRPAVRRFYTWSCDVHCRTCLTEREMLAGHARIYHRSNLQLQIDRFMYRQHPTLRWSWNAFDEVDRAP